MNELNRIFQRHDVHRLRFVNFIENRRQSGGFTAAGRAGDEDESRFFLRDFPENAGKLKCLQRGNVASSWRRTTAKFPRCRKILTRKRASSLSE